jgi:putative hydrolase of the HAD superfamily
VAARLYETETRNMQHYGYGIKAFALSMIETALDLTEDRVSGADIRGILDAARSMLTAHVELVANVADTVEVLAARYPLMVITKGDLRDQQAKMARSGLASRFTHVEVVAEKTETTYERLLGRHGIAVDRFLMVGNSLKSDVLPVLALGGTAVYVPHELTWAYETATPPPATTRGYHEIPHLGLLPGLVDTLEGER